MQRSRPFCRSRLSPWESRPCSQGCAWEYSLRSSWRPRSPRVSWSPLGPMSPVSRRITSPIPSANVTTIRCGSSRCGSRRKREPELLVSTSGWDCNVHPDGLRGTRRQSEHSRLVAEVAGESRRVGDTVPGLHTDEACAGFGPQSQIRRIRILDPHAWTGGGTVGHRPTADPVQDHYIVLEQLILQHEATIEDRKSV